MNYIDSMKNFIRSEFPNGVEDHCTVGLLKGIQEYRTILGYPVMPSPLNAGWYRLDDESKESRHYAYGKSTSDAGDIFPICPIAKAWRVAVSMGIWGGIGFYMDTKPRPMLHLDLRPTPHGVLPLWWCRIDGEYYYPVNGSADTRIFFEALYKGE